MGMGGLYGRAFRCPNPPFFPQPEGTRVFYRPAALPAA